VRVNKREKERKGEKNTLSVLQCVAVCCSVLQCVAAYTLRYGPGRLGWVVSVVTTVKHVERLGQKKRKVQREREREAVFVCG